MSTEKYYNRSIYGYDHLMTFYKRIFGIFHWLNSLPSSVDRKINSTSNLIKKYNFLFVFLNLLCFIRFLKTVYCHSVTEINTEINIERVILANFWSTAISLSCYMFHFDNYKNLLFELKYLDKLILKRLSHKINYQKLRNSIMILIVIYLAIFMTLVFQMVIYLLWETTPIWFKFIIFSVKCINLYIQFHAIFLIRLQHFIYEMFSKYINFAHHLNRSNLLFPNVNKTDNNLRFYKEIHYKLWTVMCELNNVFGSHFIAFFCQRFYEVTGNMSSLLIIWENGQDFWSLRFLCMSSH